MADAKSAAVASSAAASPVLAASPAETKAPMRFFLCRGRSTTRGKYRGVIETDPSTGEGVSIFWNTQEIELALPESAYLECQSDPEIVVVAIREISAEDAAAHVRGPVVAGELAKLESASTEALEAEIARRRAAKAIAGRNGKGN